MCDCMDGITGDDEHGPIYCEQCPTGLDLAMSDCAKREQGWIEAQATYAPAEQSPFWKEMHKQAQVLASRLEKEYYRLEALYNAMKPDAALAWQERSDQVRKEVASMAVLQEARA